MLNKLIKFKNKQIYSIHKNIISQNNYIQQIYLLITNNILQLFMEYFNKFVLCKYNFEY